MNIANPGEVFEPYNAKQTEVGAKYDSGRIGGGIALFQTAQPNGGIYKGRFAIDGEQRNRGIELSVYGEARRGVRVLGGLTLLDTEQRNTGLAATEGRRAIGVPEISSFLRGETDRETMIAVGKQATRRYAKRQYTWFAHQPPADWPRFTEPLETGAMPAALALMAQKP